LKDTFQALGKETLRTLDSFDNYNKTNFKQLRQLSSESNSSSIPYIGIYLKDLTYLLELPLYIDDNLINIKKLSMESKAIRQKIFYFFFFFFLIFFFF
jgi:hypothetical protein